jgi:hypothetical protein
MAAAPARFSTITGCPSTSRIDYQPRHQIDAAAGRITDDDAHGVIGIARLRQSLPGAGKHRRTGRDEQTA